MSWRKYFWWRKPWWKPWRVVLFFGDAPYNERPCLWSERNADFEVDRLNDKLEEEGAARPYHYRKLNKWKAT